MSLDLSEIIVIEVSIHTLRKSFFLCTKHALFRNNIAKSNFDIINKWKK
jgi:hypothetical protein